MEIERQLKKHISHKDLNEIGFLFESRYHTNWKFVCKALNQILQFDQVFILQLQNSGESHVIAETNNGKLPSFNNKYFSSSFLPTEVIQHYENSSYRYIENASEQPQELHFIKKDIDLNITQVNCFPTIKFKYYQYVGVNTALSFPLYLNGHFWGVVIANNKNYKPVDLQTRKVCTFIVQNAMSKYEAYVKEGQIKINSQIQKFQSELLERLTFHKTINCALVENLENLQTLMNADGIGIYNEGDIYVHGHTPSESLFSTIISFLQKSNKTNYVDHNFKKKYQKFFNQKLPFAGILAYNIDKKKDYYILWFRNEHIYEETHFNAFQETSLHPTLFTEKKIFHTSKPWSDQELMLLEGLQQTLNHSLIEKFVENKIKAKKLSEINNELEMFTYSLSHDLKNPLSVLKMGVNYFKERNKNQHSDAEKKWLNTLSLGIQNMEDIINNIIHVSDIKVNKISKETIPLQYMLRKIVEEIKLAQQNNLCDVKFGTLLPIWGERSATYQIFTNIISNALKYSANNPSPIVRIDSRLEGGMVSYIIEDNGIGIPQKDLNKIFDMFTRGDNAKEYAGSGIGLCLVRRIIERLDGNITIVSKENHGTTVHIQFPIQQHHTKVLTKDNDPIEQL